MKYTATYLILLVFLMLFANVSKGCVCVSDRSSIDNLTQLDEYNFIAHVRVVEDEDYEVGICEERPMGSVLRIEILEQFKGVPVDEIYEAGRYSSCDMGVSKDEEWILFGKGNENEPWVSACDRDIRYRKSDGFRDWKGGYGFERLQQLRKLYNHPAKKYGNEIREECYPNGQIEIREVYKNGELEGERKLWYPNGNVYGIEYYKNGKKDGQSKWYYPLGQIYREDYYVNGKPSNISRQYYDSIVSPGVKKLLIESFYKTEDSLNYVYKRVQVHYGILYDADGHEIIRREYSRLGEIKSEIIIDPITKLETIIYYHENGLVSSIEHRKDGERIGRYQEYNEIGKPQNAWGNR